MISTKLWRSRWVEKAEDFLASRFFLNRSWEVAERVVDDGKGL